MSFGIQCDVLYSILSSKADTDDLTSGLLDV